MRELAACQAQIGHTKRLVHEVWNSCKVWQILAHATMRELAVSETDEACQEVSTWRLTQSRPRHIEGVGSMSETDGTHREVYAGHLHYNWDSLLVRAPDSWSKGCEFESWQEWFENFLFQSWLCVLTLIRCLFHPCVTMVVCKRPGHSAKSAGGRLHLSTHTPLTQQSWSGLTATTQA